MSSPRTSSTRRCAARRAVGSSMGAADRITAPVPAADAPSARVTSATASHSCPVSSGGAAALVPEASRYTSPTLRATRSGKARTTTAPAAKPVPIAAPLLGAASVPVVVGARRSSRSASAFQRRASGEPDRRSAVTSRARSPETPASTAATTSAARRGPTSAAPSTRARAHRGAAGISARRRPAAVARPASSTAPSDRSTASSPCTDAAGNGDGKRSDSPRGVPHAASVSSAPVRSAVCDSGVTCGLSAR